MPTVLATLPNIFQRSAIFREQLHQSYVHDLFRALCVVNVGLWDHLIHFFVRELLTSQTVWTTSRLLGNAISPARLCDFRVLREVAAPPWQYTCRVTLLDVPLWTARRSPNLSMINSSLCSPAESLAGVTGPSAFATVCSLMAGTIQSFVRCAVLPVTAVFCCCSPFRAPSASCRALHCRNRYRSATM